MQLRLQHRYAVCGLGSSAPRYEATYQAAAKQLSEMLSSHGASAVCSMGEEDEQMPRVGYEVHALSSC
jgi:sulfite reductase alpha subunit-like flavoprotein